MVLLGKIFVYESVYRRLSACDLCVFKLAIFYCLFEYLFLMNYYKYRYIIITTRDKYNANVERNARHNSDKPKRSTARYRI